jgi:uncharacterized RDD family membrane protein YckC
MACANHPEVITGLDACTACSKTFCIDCLVGRKSGWFCAPCDPEPKAGAAPAVAVAAKPKTPSTGACTTHPEVLDKLLPCTRCDRVFCPDCLVQLKGSRFCAECKVNAVKDLQSGVNEKGLPLASIGARFVAALIDQFVLMAAMFVVIIAMAAVVALTRPGPDSMVMPLVVFGCYGIMFAFMFCYHALMLQWKGQTLGKMAMKIKVVTPEGGTINPGQAWIRVLVWFFLSGCGIDYLPAFFNDEKMAIHDMAARTRVVKVG